MRGVEIRVRSLVLHLQFHLVDLGTLYVYCASGQGGSHEERRAERERRTIKAGFGLLGMLHGPNPICWLRPKCENGWIPSGRTRRKQVGLEARGPRAVIQIVSTVLIPTPMTAGFRREGSTPVALASAGARLEM